MGVSGSRGLLACSGSLLTLTTTPHPTPHSHSHQPNQITQDPVKYARSIYVKLLIPLKASTMKGALEVRPFGTTRSCDLGGEEVCLCVCGGCRGGWMDGWDAGIVSLSASPLNPSPSSTNQPTNPHTGRLEHRARGEEGVFGRLVQARHRHALLLHRCVPLLVSSRLVSSRFLFVRAGGVYASQQRRRTTRRRRDNPIPPSPPNHPLTHHPLQHYTKHHPIPPHQARSCSSRGRPRTRWRCGWTTAWWRRSPRPPWRTSSSSTT